MAYPILSTHPFHGYLFNREGDLAIVFEGPYAKANAPHPLTAEVFQRVNEMGVGKRLSSLHVVCPYHKEKGKEIYPLKELRKGWDRVYREIITITPNVKRVLLVSLSALLTKVVMPGVPGLADTHGTIFTLDCGLEVVPTWIKAYPHMREWKARDIERWKTLIKTEPLPYLTSLDGLCGKHIVVDLETQDRDDPTKGGLDCTKDIISVLGVQWSDTHRAIITGADNIQLGIEKLTNLVKSGSHITFHNGQFDLGFMGQAFRDAVTDFEAVHCTLIRSRARGELVNTLKHLGNHYTDRPGNYAWAKPGNKHEYNNPDYVTEDLETTWQLSKVFEKDGERPIVQQMEKAIVMACEQTIHGSYIDKSKLETLLEDGKKNIALWEELCLAYYGVHPGKTKELSHRLIQMGHELTKKTPAGNWVLDEDVCEEHGLNLLLNYRKAVKLDSSFVGKIHKLLRPDGTLPHYQSMMGADTGRTTMSNFNHQQASRHGPVRGLVKSRFEGGKILIVDLAQLELRVLAYIANDEVFAQLFKEEDPHKANASRAFGVPLNAVTKDMRTAAKIVIFLIIYGGMPKDEGQRIVERFFKSRFKKSFDWIAFTNKVVREYLEVTDPYGKTRNLREVNTWRGKSGVGRAGVNSPIQGSGSHIAMQVTYNCWWLFRKYKLQSKIIFGVHDSVVGDIHPDEEDICVKLVRLAFAMLRSSHMHKAFPLAEVLPMEGDIMLGESWGWIDEQDEMQPDDPRKVITKIKCSSHDTITEEEIDYHSW